MSLEYKLFLAENPGYYKDLEAQNPIASKPRDSSIDVGSQTLISGNRQFESYAPIFNKADPYEIQTRAATSINAYGSTMSDTRKSNLMMRSSVERPNRFGFTRRTGANSVMHSAYDDLNERDEGFDINREVMNGTLVAGKSSGLSSGVMVRSGSTEPRQSSVHSLTAKAIPRTQLISSAKMQLIGSKMQQPSATLHNTSSGAILPPTSEIENPLIGYSEGETQRKLYKEEFMRFALS